MLAGSDLFISLFAQWSFILSLLSLFHALGSTVILCSFTHFFPLSLLMLPVVHGGAGSAPEQAESQWWCQSSAECQSHLNLSTAQLPFVFCFNLLSFNSIFCFTLQPDSLFLNTSNTQSWLLHPLLTFLLSLISKDYFCLQTTLQWISLKKTHPGHTNTTYMINHIKYLCKRRSLVTS